MNLARVALSCQVLVAAAWLAPHAAGAEVKPAQVKAIKKGLAEKRCMLVDVREKSEWDAGHLEQSILLPLSELEELDEAGIAKRLPKEKKIYAFCAAGFRADRAADQLKQLGYRVEAVTGGGYKEMVKAGFKAAPVKQTAP